VNLGKPEVHGEDVVIHADVLATAFRAAQDARPAGPDKRGEAQKATQ
jgi:hypothetical protein